VRGVDGREGELAQVVWQEARTLADKSRRLEALAGMIAKV